MKTMLLLAAFVAMPLVGSATNGRVAFDSATADSLSGTRKAPTSSAASFQGASQGTSPQATSAQGTQAKPHTIAVKFDYDFKLTPACTAKVKEKCVSGFAVYDISGGPTKAFKLMTVPVPDGASGMMKGITATTPPRVFAPGKHLISVTAVDPKGTESGRPAATIWVTIP